MEALVTASLIATLEVTKRLVEVMLTAKMLVGLKAPETERLLKLALFANKLVEVMDVPLAVLKVKPPVKLVLPKTFK